jgi:hypothetical protein
MHNLSVIYFAFTLFIAMTMWLGFTLGSIVFAQTPRQQTVHFIAMLCSLFAFIISFIWLLGLIHKYS